MAALVVCGAALWIRILVFLLTIDVTGDGPAHALQAYEWSKHPRWIWSGVWLPGINYWAGIASLFIPNPLIAPRLVNLTFGTLTVPVFYFLIRRLYGSNAALLSALMVAIVPLHVGLSVSSMTEPSFLFFVLAALLCLTYSVSGRGLHTGPLGLGLLFLLLAEMTRYEAWSLVPLVLAYLYWRCRRVSMCLLSGAVLLVFPVGWSIASYLYSGNAFEGFFAALQPHVEGVAAVPFPEALMNVARGVTHNLGELVAAAVLCGFLREVVYIARCVRNREQAAYTVCVGAVWILVFLGAVFRGPGLYNRYLLVGCILALPFAAVSYVRYCGHYRHSLALGALIGVVALGGALVAHKPQLWVTRGPPGEVVELTRWLRQTRYRDTGVLLTKINWNSTYVPLYVPELSGRCLIVSVWVDDSALSRFISQQKPFLLITQAADAFERARIEKALERTIRPERRVFSAGRIEAYDLSS